jgi:hypothetical protein
MRAPGLHRALRILLLAVCTLGVGRAARAQGLSFTRLEISGFPLTSTSTSPANFDAGAVIIGTTSFTVDLTFNLFGFSPRITSVRVNCALPCPATGTLPVSGMQWRRADLAGWNTLTTTPTLIETRTAFFNGANDPWGNSLQWRYLLSWTGRPPAAASTFHIRFELVVTAP